MNNKWLIIIGLVATLVVGVIVGAVWTTKKMAAKIIDNFTYTEHVEDDAPETCQDVEALMNGRLEYYSENSQDTADHLVRAKTFATMALHGCPENAEKYKALALREVEIVRALSHDASLEDYEVVGVVDTYKHLDMEDEARAFIDTIKRLTAPAVEFIQAVEKVLEEGN